MSDMRHIPLSVSFIDVSRQAYGCVQLIHIRMLVAADCGGCFKSHI